MAIWLGSHITLDGARAHKKVLSSRHATWFFGNEAQVEPKQKSNREPTFAAPSSSTCNPGQANKIAYTTAIKYFKFNYISTNGEPIIDQRTVKKFVH